ncbi:MAG: Endo-alpha-mannosidase, partial [Chthonomonadales bacterium]|nr:Endo-alpha-mannosidase [Chthonomonadales bacterium]
MPNQWAGILKEASGGNPPGIMAITDNENPADSAVWDGSYSLWPITQMGGLSPFQSAQTLHQSFQAQIHGKRAFNHLTVETITPGYDDLKYNAFAEIGPGTLVDRLNGQRYRSLWEQELKDAPDWVLINSFNQWHNGTEIEPSREMGDRYLQLTGTYARRFKSGNAVSIHRSAAPSHHPNTNDSSKRFLQSQF